MKNRSRPLSLSIILTVSLFLAFSGGCSGSDTRENLNNAVEEMAGKDKIEQMQDMKQAIEQVQKRQGQRYDQLDTTD